MTAIASERGNTYFSVSRSPRYSILFALPLLAGYETLAAVLSSDGVGYRNGADALLKGAFAAAAGRNGPLIFMAAVTLIGVWLVARDMKRSGSTLQPVVFATMLAESAVLALVFGVVVGLATAQLLGSLHLPAMVASQGIESMGPGTRLMMSLGAGIYEELFFRVLLVSGIAACAKFFLGFGPRGAGVVATVVGAVIFSAFHYVGSLGDPFTVQSFVFRTIAGLAFSALYLVRGFGIVAWTHALYDAFLLLF